MDEASHKNRFYVQVYLVSTTLRKSYGTRDAQVHGVSHLVFKMQLSRNQSE